MSTDISRFHIQSHAANANKDVMENFELDLDSEEFTNTAIFKAIRQMDAQKVLAAVYSGENVHLRDPEFNSTYLHLVVSIADSLTEDKLVPIVYCLSNAGVDVNAQDYKGRNALEIAMHRELLELMVALLRVGVDPYEKDYKAIVRNRSSPFEIQMMDTYEKYEPGLWTAVKNNDTGMVHMLVNSWCRINLVKNGRTLLQYARETYKSEELINTLDDFEVTIEFVHATLAGDEKRMLEFLMDSKPCDPDIMDISHQESWSKPLSPRSLRDTAIAMGHTHVLNLLPEPDENTNATIMPCSDPQDMPYQDRGNSAAAAVNMSHLPRTDSNTSTESGHPGFRENYTAGTFNSQRHKEAMGTLLHSPINLQNYKEGSFAYYYHPEPQVQKRTSTIPMNHYAKNWKKLHKSKNKSKMCSIS